LSVSPGRAAEDGRSTVAHLVTPYLFLTGSWIHAQLAYNRAFRAIVLTQQTEHLETFPFDPVFDLSKESQGLRRLPFLIRKYLRGEFPRGPYLRILRRERAKLIHAHLGWEGARNYGLARELSLPFVVSFYGQDAGYLHGKAYWRVLYKRLFRYVDRVVVEGPHMAEVLASIGAPRDRIRVHHLGIPIDDFPFAERHPESPLSNGEGADAGAIIGLIAASFREKKGIPFALEALARVAREHPRVRLRLIGGGPMQREIEERIARPDLAGRVDLLGYQPYPVYRAELARAHFLMAPSVTARDGDAEGGAPVCLLEAQAAGLPIIATTHCDIPEVTRPEESALLAPERDVTALAACLDRLLRSPERWGAMGRAGRAHVEKQFNIRTQVERMNGLYSELT
jgi:colanic acid/amylovoran biosynthesis glycosyltransferase